MKILFLASGSGGHIYPSLSLMNYLITYHQIGYVIMKESLENKIKIDERITKYFLNVYPKSKYYLKPYNTPKLFLNILKLSLKVKDYDLIIAFGGFSSFVGAILSKINHTKLYIHEQNQTLGDSNKFALKYASKLFTVYDSLKIDKKYINKVVCVGNPRYDEAIKYYKKEVSITPFKILIFAGSLGSSTLSKIFVELVNDIKDERIEFIIITGNKHYDLYKNIENKNVKIYQYKDNLLPLMSSSNLAIIRGGATTIEEVLALKIPSIVIPSPFVKHNHQYGNALFYKQKNLLIVKDELNLSIYDLKQEILRFVNNKTYYYVFKERLESFNRPSSLKLIKREIEND